MEVVLKTHTKLKAGEVGVGKTFRLIAQMKAFQVIDLAQAVAGILDLKKASDAGAILAGADSDALVFAVDLGTGKVEHFAKDMEVYLCPLKTFERDEE